MLEAGDARARDAGGWEMLEAQGCWKLGMLETVEAGGLRMLEAQGCWRLGC